MNKCKIAAILGLTLFLSISQSVAGDQDMIREKVDRGSFTPMDPPPVINYQDDDLTLRAIYNNAGDRLSLQIDSRTAAPQLVAMPDVMAQLTEVRPVYGNRIAAIGLASSVVSVVAVIDRKTGTVSDTFYGYKPTISPDGQWMAFQEFFPPHFNEDIHSRYRVYDTSLGASGNRRRLTDVSDPQLVGAIVYPLRPHARQAEHSATRKDGEHPMVSNVFFWGARSDRFIFATGKGKALNLVLVKLKEDGKSWETFIYDLNHDGSTCATTCEVSRVTSFALEEETVVTQVSPGQLGAKASSFRVPLDQFARIN